MRYLRSVPPKSASPWRMSTSNRICYGRIKFIFVFCLFFFLFLVGRLFQLQVIQGSQFRAQSDNNRILLRDVMAARGVIYDRNNQHLVTNQPVQRLLVDENGMLVIDGPILDRKEVLQYEATSSGNLVTTVGRYYPYGEALAHLVGYVAEANQEELNQGRLLLGEMTGKAGIEKTLNPLLMGHPGTELVELNAQGKLLRRVGQKPAQAGQDVVLHIDATLQQELFYLMQNRPGAAVVSQPKTGAILALVSSPSFDPNVFGYSQKELGISDTTPDSRSIQDLLTSESRPLVNRTISGVYPPGSVYKVVPSVAALENEVIQANTEVEDIGVITIDQYQFRNWYYTKYGGGEGLIDLTRALQRSNDIYYYKIGEWVGVDSLAEWSRSFGLGAATGIDLPGEVNGLVPDPVWKERIKNERWFLGNTYHMSIGQGDLLTTPIQVHQMMGVIANGGRWCKPQLIQSVGTHTYPDAECVEIGIQKETIEAVKKGLIAACQPGGTGVPFFDFKLAEASQRFNPSQQVACKTGTAQFFDPQNRTHAWFSIFAPAENPEIMVTILVEAGGEGSEVAAPIAREILDWWYRRENK